MTDRTRAHVLVSGTVQGVTFRASTRRKANSTDVDGWVKNRPDGRVEAVFEGPEPAVETMIEWCHDGPRPAHVEDVDVTYEDPIGITGFRIDY